MNKILILLGTSLTLTATPATTSIEHDRGYLAGMEDGATMAIAAVNAQMCLNRNPSPPGIPHPECVKFIEEFSALDDKRTAVEKRIQEANKNGKSSPRNKKNPN